MATLVKCDNCGKIDKPSDYIRIVIKKENPHGDLSDSHEDWCVSCIQNVTEVRIIE